MIVCQGVPFSRGILCQGSAPLIPFSRGVLCQGPLFPFPKGWQLPLSQGAPLMLHPPFCKGCPFSRIIPGSHPFPKGAPFPRNYPFAMIQRPNFIIGVQLMWGTLSICFVLQDSFARVSRNTWTRAESSLFCNKAKFSCPYLWNCPLITLGHRKACDLIVAIQCS